MLLEYVHAEFGFLKIKKMFLKITIKQRRQVFVTTVYRRTGYARGTLVIAICAASGRFRKLRGLKSISAIQRGTEIEKTDIKNI